jgi:hypothetical protein
MNIESSLTLTMGSTKGGTYKPIVSQVAAIWEEGSDTVKQFERSIMVCGTFGELQYIKAYHRCYDPLSYPLFSPRREVGWNKKILYANQGDPVEGLCVSL